MPNVHLALAVDAARERFNEEIEMAAKYKWLTDPAPLTVELIEQELGLPDQRSDYGSCIWKNVNGNEVYYRHDNKLFVNGSTLFWVKTLGHLRHIVAMLRGGGK